MNGEDLHDRARARAQARVAELLGAVLDHPFVVANLARATRPIDPATFRPITP